MSEHYSLLGSLVYVHHSGRTCCLHVHHTSEDHSLQIQRDQGKLRKFLTRITNLVAKVWKNDLPNMKQNWYPLNCKIKWHWYRFEINEEKLVKLQLDFQLKYTAMSYMLSEMFLSTIWLLLNVSYLKFFNGQVPLFCS